MRKIVLDGAKNVRDFGGITNKKGKKIRKNLFLRSNTLHLLSKDDVEVLKGKHDLMQVIDLRTDEEISEAPDVDMEGVQWTHIPLVDGSTIGITHEEETKNQMFNPDNIPNMVGLYTHIVTDEYSVSKIKKVFEAILHSKDGSILWHCTEGKDRCGIISALFLSILDVEHSIIMEDYLMTNDYAKNNAELNYEKVLNKTNDPKIAEKIRCLFIADKVYLQAAYESIKKTWGSIETFIEEKLGISDSMKKELQNWSLEQE